jgi:hypothetical protein
MKGCELDEYKHLLIKHVGEGVGINSLKWNPKIKSHVK